MRFSDDSPTEPVSPEKREHRRPPDPPPPRPTNGAAKKSTKIKRTPKLLRSSYSSRESSHEERLSSEAKNGLSADSPARESSPRDKASSSRQGEGVYWAQAFTNSDSDDTFKQSAKTETKSEKRGDSRTSLDEPPIARREHDMVVCEERKSIEESSHILDSVSRSARSTSISVSKPSSPAEKTRPNESMMKNLYEFANRSRSRAPIHDSVASNYKFVQEYQSERMADDQTGGTRTSAHSSHEDGSSLVRKTNETNVESKLEIVTDKRGPSIDTRQPDDDVEPRERYSLARKKFEVGERKPKESAHQIPTTASQSSSEKFSKAREYFFRDEKDSSRPSRVSPDDGIYVEPYEQYVLGAEEVEVDDRKSMESASSRSNDSKFSSREHFFRQEKDPHISSRISPDDGIYVEPSTYQSHEREKVRHADRNPPGLVNENTTTSSRSKDDKFSGREYFFREEKDTNRSSRISPDDGIYVEPGKYHSLEKEKVRGADRNPTESVNQNISTSSRSSDDNFSKRREYFFHEEPLTDAKEDESKSRNWAGAEIKGRQVTKVPHHAQFGDNSKQDLSRKADAKQEEARVSHKTDDRRFIPTRISPIEDSSLWRTQEYHFKKEGPFGSEHEESFVKERIPVDKLDRPYLKKRVSSDDDVFESASDNFWKQESIESLHKESQLRGSVGHLHMDRELIPEMSHIDDLLAKKREYFLQKGSPSSGEGSKLKAKGGSSISDSPQSGARVSAHDSPDANAFSRTHEHLVQKESYSDGRHKESKLKDVQHFVAQHSQGVSPEYKRHQSPRLDQRSAADEYNLLEKDLNHFRAEMKRLSGLISEGKRKLEKKLLEENERKVTRIENVYDFEVRLPMHESRGLKSPPELRSRSEASRDLPAGSKPLDRLQDLLKENWWSGNDSKPTDGGPFSKEQYEVLLNCLKDLKNERSSSGSSFDEVIELLSKEVTKTVEYKSSDKEYHTSSTDEQPKGRSRSSSKSDAASSSYKTDSSRKTEVFDAHNQKFGNPDASTSPKAKSDSQFRSNDRTKEKLSDKFVESSEYFEEKYADSSSRSYDYSSRKYSDESHQLGDHLPDTFRHVSMESDVYPEQTFVDSSKRLYEVPDRFAELYDRRNERYEQMFSDISGKHANYERKFTDSWKYVDKDHFERRYGDESMKRGDRSKSSQSSNQSDDREFHESNWSQKSADTQRPEESTSRSSDRSERYNSPTVRFSDASAQSAEYSELEARNQPSRSSPSQPYHQPRVPSSHHSQYSPDSLAAGCRSHSQRSAPGTQYRDEERSYSPPLVVTSRLLKGNSGAELRCPEAQTANNQEPSVAYPYVTHLESASSSATASPCASSQDVPKVVRSSTGTQSEQPSARPSYVSAVSYFVRDDGDPQAGRNRRSAEQVDDAGPSSLPPPVNFATYPRSPTSPNPPGFSSVEYFTDERITKYEVGA